MKMPTRLLIAAIAALVLPFVVPGFAWLLPSRFLRALFAFGVVWIVWSFFQPRAHVNITREKDPKHMAIWSIVAALVFTAIITILWGVVGWLGGTALGFIHDRQDGFRSMILVAIISFMFITRHYLRKNQVI